MRARDTVERCFIGERMRGGRERERLSNVDQILKGDNFGDKDYGETEHRRERERERLNTLRARPQQE